MMCIKLFLELLVEKQSKLEEKKSPRATTVCSDKTIKKRGI